MTLLSGRRRPRDLSVPGPPSSGPTPRVAGWGHGQPGGRGPHSDDHSRDDSDNRYAPPPPGQASQQPPPQGQPYGTPPPNGAPGGQPYGSPGSQPYGSPGSQPYGIPPERPRGGYREALGWGVIALGGLLVMIMFFRFVTLFAGLSIYSDDLAYGTGNAIAPGLLGLLLLLLRRWLVRAPRPR